VLSRVFADYDAERGAEIELSHILHEPARSFDLSVNLLSRPGFRRHLYNSPT
jgi:hypothetical protein